jgi:predicted transcriptional regulator of viral defense system
VVLTVLEVAETRPERRILDLAARQHGLVTTRQLLAAGWSRDVIATRLRSGWLDRRYRGVYLAGPLETAHTPAMAAVLACGDGAVISHYSAAVLWSLRQPIEGPMHVIAPSAHNRPGIIVHHASLHPHDITCRHGIPVTSAARALLDLAATAPIHDVERAVNEAHVQHRVSTHSLNEQFSRYPPTEDERHSTRRCDPSPSSPAQKPNA